jgi:hypothetical protein
MCSRFLTSLVGRFNPGVIAPSTHFIGGWVNSKISMDAVEKRKKSYHAGSQSRATQPVAIPTELSGILNRRIRIRGRGDGGKGNG